METCVFFYNVKTILILDKPWKGWMGKLVFNNIKHNYIKIAYLSIGLSSLSMNNPENDPMKRKRLISIY